MFDNDFTGNINSKQIQGFTFISIIPLAPRSVQLLDDANWKISLVYKSITVESC